MNPEKVSVTCPHCGQAQLEPRDGYSTVCKKCRQHFRIDGKPTAKVIPDKKRFATRQVACFQCGTPLEVALEAESTMCKRCSSHVDLRDYEINQAVSKNFRTYGTFVVGEKGYVFNTEVEVGDAVLKGRFLGKLHAHRTLTLHPSAEFKGTFKAGLLIIPAGTHLHWKTALTVENLEVAGELVTNVKIPGAVRLKSTGRLFGDVEATDLVVEAGAVLVGNVKIQPKPALALAPSPETVP